MNKAISLIVVIILLNCSNVFSQIEFALWSNNHLQLNSIYGNSSPEAVTVVLRGNGNINLKNWKLAVRLKQPIKTNGNNNVIPADKVSFSPSSTAGILTPLPVPTVSQVGFNPNTILNQNTDVFLLNNALTPLYNNSPEHNTYYEFNIKFNLNVLGGNYLYTLPTWANYIMVLEFKLLDEYNNVIGRQEISYILQIGNIGQQPTNVLSLQVASNAQNANLTLNNTSAYNNGTSATYAKGLIVNANTNYEIKVKSLQQNFTSTNLHTLPLDIIKVELIYPQTGYVSYPRWLSSLPQTVAEGVNTNNSNIFYDIKYSTQPKANALFDAKMDEYFTTLQFEIIPK